MAKLLFYEPTHTYTLGGVEIPGVTEICAPLLAGKYPAVAGVVNAAAARGTRIHELCALYDMEALPDEIEAEAVPYLQAWAAFCRDFRPTWEFVELRMFGEIHELPIAGTADRIGLIDGKRCVVDIKTAQSMERASKIALCCQLEGYAHMSPHPICSRGLGVQLMKDGSYRVLDQAKLEKKYGFDSLLLLAQLRRIHYITKGK